MASTYLSGTLGSPTSAYKGTLSWWQKGITQSNSQYILACESGTERLLWYITQGQFQGGVRGSSTPPDIDISLSGTPKFVDISSWYHCVLAWDTTQGSASDRLKYYVNGTQYTISSSGTGGVNDIPQNHTMPMNKSGLPFRIGSTISGGSYFDGVMSHLHFCDGIQYAASDFGETDATTGEWKIKVSPSVTYGNNGFFVLKDGNSATDQSGQGNNLSVSGTLTKTEDNPSNVFCTLNTLDNSWTGGRITLANGNNNTMNTSGAGDFGLRGTLAVRKGKYYMEFRTNNSGDGANTLAIAPTDLQLVQNITSGSPTSGVYGVQRYSDSSTNIYNNGTFISQNTAMFGGYTNNSDIISFALDLDNSKMYVAKNGVFKDTSGNTGDPAAGTNPTFTGLDSTKFYTFYTELRLNQNNGTQCNFGNGYFGTTAVSSAGTNASNNGIFEYDVPAGFTALSTKGINSF